MMSHPPRATRDTATYRPYQKAHGKAGGKLRPKSLKILSQEHLDRMIQSGQHNPVRACAWFDALLRSSRLHIVFCWDARLKSRRARCGRGRCRAHIEYDCTAAARFMALDG